MRLVLSGLFCLALCGCSQPEKISYADLLSTLTNVNQVASLAEPQTHLITSYDRTGANEDYNHFQGKTSDGRFVLADLKGPGVMTRFWFTSDPHDTRFYFYFDDESSPRFSFTWAELDQKTNPLYLPPLAMTEQICWRSFLPVPFSKRLLIVVDDAGYGYGTAPKLYYQVNWNSLPSRTIVESLSPALLQENRPLINQISSTWDSMSFSALPVAAQAGELPPGGSLDLFSTAHPGTLNGMMIQPDLSQLSSPRVRAAMLRDVMVKIYWDGQDEPSVAVPFGDFFGSMWQQWAGQAMMFGQNSDEFFCRWPMPFRKGARVVLENEGSAPLSLRWGVQVDEQMPSADAGYFHAAFTRSGTQSAGTPHTVLKTDGDGKYVGCILGVWSIDNSFWVLESDETMRIDGQKDPLWQGTGLEDYFNAGWYYRKVFDRPLHGLSVKSPFRTVQYRLHLDDAVRFDKSFDMVFERGPGQVSKALYDSVAFYYLSKPQKSAGWPGSPVWRARPRSRLEQLTLMTDLWNFERFDDLAGEIDWIDQYLEQFNPPFAAVLKLRQVVCRYLAGTLSQPDLMKDLDVFIASEDPTVRSFAQNLKTFYSDTSVFLLGAYCNMKSEVYLDGQLLLTAGNPEQPAVVPVRLEKGKHVIAVKSVWQSYPYWMQAWVQAPGGLLTEGQDWKHAVNPSGDWSALSYDDTAWNPAGYSLEGVKSPPEIPYVRVVPDPYVNASSKALPVCPGDPWETHQGGVVYRKVFEVK